MRLEASDSIAWLMRLWNWEIMTKVVWSSSLLQKNYLDDWMSEVQSRINKVKTTSVIEYYGRWYCSWNQSWTSMSAGVELVSNAWITKEIRDGIHHFQAVMFNWAFLIENVIAEQSLCPKKGAGNNFTVDVLTN